MVNVLPLTADTAAGAPALVASWHALHAAVELELEPPFPPSPLEEALADATSDAMSRKIGWLAVEGVEVIGYAVAELPLLDNRHLATVHAGVHAAHRRRGIGTALTRLAVSAVAEAGRRTLLVEAPDGSPGEAMCAAMGAERALVSTPSILSVCELDRRLLDRWIERRDERATGYSLLRWVDRCPDDLLEPTSTLRESLNDAPMGTLDFTVEYSAELTRAAELHNTRCNRKQYAVCARHDETGDVVALTDVVVPHGRPSLGLQYDTVVRGDHRNRGLGRWVKAEMLRWLLDAEPRLELLTTWNAAVNAAMRGINTELGFVPQSPWSEWQFDVEKLLAQVG